MISELSIVLIPVEVGTTWSLFPFLTKIVMTFLASGAVFAGYWVHIEDHDGMYEEKQSEDDD
jgi:hypothetical protein